MIRGSFIILLLLSVSCAKKTDADLFSEGAVTIDLTVNPKVGYRPLAVDVSGYLQTEERSVERVIEEAKWLIKGPRGYEREIIEGSSNFQNKDENHEGFFYLEYEFNIPGRYTIQLLLNNGEYASRKMRVNVLDRQDENTGRF